MTTATLSIIGGVFYKFLISNLFISFESLRRQCVSDDNIPGVLFVFFSFLILLHSNLNVVQIHFKRYFLLVLILILSRELQAFQYVT